MKNKGWFSIQSFIHQYRLVPTIIALLILAVLVPVAVSNWNDIQQHDEAASSYVRNANAITEKVRVEIEDIAELEHKRNQQTSINLIQAIQGQITVAENSKQKHEEELYSLIHLLSEQVKKKNESTTLWTICIAVITFVIGTLAKPLIDVLQDRLKDWFKSKLNRPAELQTNTAVITFNNKDLPKPDQAE